MTKSAPPPMSASDGARSSLGLPATIVACLFDLDGVLTRTALVHAGAWKQTFDAFLRQRAGQSFIPFDAEADYERYVDGKPRADGVRDFLTSRGITLPEGSHDDPPGEPSINGLANAKNEQLVRQIEEHGVQVYPDAARYLRAVREAGLHAVVVSSSANAAQVLQVTGLAPLIEARVDGEVLRQQHLHGKPAPDSFLAAAAQLGLRPAQAAVFEDAISGVQAGAAGGFGLVVGINRLTPEHGAQLRAAGAGVVVESFAELSVNI